jgi:hypothetical protein
VILRVSARTSPPILLLALLAAPGAQWDLSEHQQQATEILVGCHRSGATGLTLEMRRLGWAHFAVISSFQYNFGPTQERDKWRIPL